eukprot:Hpha_TRINITY_DN15330_c2_g1::TRINITY_DN15330_c2_g1_i1::g.88701::m.88701
MMARSAVLLLLPAVVSADLTWDLAQRILLEATWTSTQLGAEQSVCLQDDGGNLKGFLRQDHSWPLGGDVACKKARTSGLFKSRSGIIGSLSVPGGSLWRVETSNGGLVTNAGGVQFDGGAVGAAGSTSAEDHTVALAGASQTTTAHETRPSGPLTDATLGVNSGLNSTWELSAGQAWAVVDAAVAASRAQNVHMDVAVVDAFGNLKAFARQEGTWYGSADIAVRKARTAAAFLRSTTEIREKTQPGEDLWNLEVSLGDFGVTSLGGGLVLRYRGTPIGALGVSGSTQNADSTVAAAAAQAVSSQNPQPIYTPTQDSALNKVYAAINHAKGLTNAPKVAVALADRGAVIKTMMSMDGSVPFNSDLAAIKARTAAGTRQTTAALSALATTTGDLATIQYSNGGLATTPGGVLLTQSENIYGSFAAHGAGTTDDVAIANAGATGSYHYANTAPSQNKLAAVAGLSSTNDASLDQAHYVLWRAQQSSSAPFALAVVDRAGRVKLAHRQDGATFGDLELAITKARTSALTGSSTESLSEKTQPGQELYMLETSGFTTVKGGVRLEAFGTNSDSGALTGGVGVHGTGDDDSDHSLAHESSLQGSQNRNAQAIYDIQLSLARSKAYSALAAGRGANARVSVAVTDERGSPRFFIRADGSALGHAGLARGKAHTAVLFNGANTGSLGTSFQPPSANYLLDLNLGGLTGIQGGTVLSQAGIRYGAIAVSGSSSTANDQTYASTGAAATSATYAQTVSAQGSQPSEVGLYGVTDVSLDQAIKVIDAALANASAYNEKVAVSVVDRFGNLKAFASADGASVASGDLSTRKARTSRFFDFTTSALGTVTTPASTLYMIEVSNKGEGGLSTISGGTPFRYTDPDKSSGTTQNVIGAIGVHGSHDMANNLRAMAAGAAAINTDYATGSYDMSIGRAQYLLRTGVQAAKSASTPVSVSVVDNGGKLRAFSRLDGAMGASVDVAIKRGRATVLFETASATLAGQTQTYTAPVSNTALYGLEWSNNGLQTGSGGAVLRAGNNVVYGSVGVAGNAPAAENAVSNAVAAGTGGVAWGWNYQFQNTMKTQQHETNPQLDLDTAWAAIEGALRKAQELNVKMNYAVVDQHGLLKAFLRDDDAWLGSIDIAMRKAKTSAAFGVKTQDLGHQSRAGQALWRVETTNDGLVSFEGGFPIRVCNTVVGAIGISGSSVELDRQVALAGAQAASSWCSEVEAAPSRNAGAAAAAAAATAAAFACL